MRDSILLAFGLFVVLGLCGWFLLVSTAPERRTSLRSMFDRALGRLDPSRLSKQPKRPQR